MSEEGRVVIDNSSYFEELDRNVESALENQEPLIWQGTDILVHDYFEVPIPITVPNSIISYRFSTLPGDISFCVVTGTYSELNEQNEVVVEGVSDTVIEPSRVASEKAPVSGEFLVPYQGYCVLQFDNSYSWLTSKSLSYHITLSFPSSDSATRIRSTKALMLLRTVKADTAVCYKEYMSIHGDAGKLYSEIHEIEAKMNELRAVLHQKAEKYNGLVEMETSLINRMEINESRVLGLCIRSLDISLLNHVLSFLITPPTLIPIANQHQHHDSVSPSSVILLWNEADFPVMSVCKLWYSLILKMHSHQEEHRGHLLEGNDADGEDVGVTGCKKSAIRISCVVTSPKRNESTNGK